MCLPPRLPRGLLIEAGGPQLSALLAEQWAHAARDRLRSLPPVGPVDVVVAMTGAPDRILAERAHPEPDLIVLGAWAGGGWAADFAAHASCPVLVLPGPASRRASR